MESEDLKSMGLEHLSSLHCFGLSVVCVLFFFGGGVPVLS